MLEALRQITQAVSQAPDQPRALSLMVERISRVLQVEVCAIYLTDFNDKKFVLMAATGLNPDSIGRVEIDFNQGLVGLIGRREEPIHLTDAQQHPAFLHVPGMKEEAFRAYLGVPIIHQRQVQGVLCIQQRAPREFSVDEETFLITLAAQISASMTLGELDNIFPLRTSSSARRMVKGAPASAGVAMGVAQLLIAEQSIHQIPDRKTQSIETELANMGRAVKATHRQLERMSRRMQGRVSEQELSLFDAYQQILASAGLEEEIEAEIQQGWWAATALKKVIQRHLAEFESMSDPYLRERAHDIEDLANRVLSHLMRQTQQARIPAQPCILLAQQISATLLAELEPDSILGIISIKGSTTSHAAILAKALGIPAVMGLEDCKLSELENHELILDGYTGQIFIDPDAGLKRHFEDLISEEKALAAELEKDRGQPCECADGTPFILQVNSNNPRELAAAFAAGASGIGLYRSEIHYMLRDNFPTERNQTESYRRLFDSAGDKPVTFRTLDIGGDKQLRYFPIEEDNPFLGWRGLRVTLDHPDLFLTQIRAVLKARRPESRLRLALPMVTTPDELEEGIRLIRQAENEVQEEYAEQEKKDALGAFAPLEIGIILEVPAVLYTLPKMLAKIDFVSVGTNDLIQYLMACDRNNQRVRRLYSHFQPALLHALKQIQQQVLNGRHVKTRRARPIELSVCGEMAADPLAAVLLMGLGLRQLSINSQALVRVKKAIAAFTQKELEQLADIGLGLTNEKAVRDLLLREFESKGLGGLVRAGS